MTGRHHHAHSPDSQRYHDSRKVTWVSVALNLVLTAAQVIVGIIGNSQALVADGIHTLSDLIGDAMVLFALGHSAKDPDEEHPYGHGRIETAVTLVLGISLALVAIGIAWRAGSRFLDAQPFTTPSTLTLWVATTTLVAKEWLYRYTLRTAARYGSALLTANAWHHRSDAISSLIVVVGVAGAILGWGYLDAIAAIVVSVLIAKIGVDLTWPALKELIDTAVSPEEREVIRRVITEVHGVKALHLLRTRRVAEHVFVDVHILVDRNCSVSEGHQIGEVVRAQLRTQIAAVSDVTVHVDSEDDNDGIEAPDLPLRDEILRRLNDYFREIPESRLIRRTTLHYTGGKIDIELRLPLSALKTLDQGPLLAAQFANAVARDGDIRRVEVGFY